MCKIRNSLDRSICIYACYISYIQYIKGVTKDDGNIDNIFLDFVLENMWRRVREREMQK